MSNTADFQQALAEGRIEEAKKWLDFIQAHRDQFPQSDDGWFVDRKREFENAKGGKRNQ